jgi:SAM-dependent methyltransferase
MNYPQGKFQILSVLKSIYSGVKTNPEIDREFKYSSPFLKQAISRYANQLLNKYCLDIPCGNGRNTFLLATHFNKVDAIDINKEYLQAIHRNSTEYKKMGLVKTMNADILAEPLNGIDKYRFICNIHFFDMGLIQSLIKSMQKNSFLLVETPACHGENFRILPNRIEVNGLFAASQVLISEFRPCKNADNVEQRGSLKILIKR